MTNCIGEMQFDGIFRICFNVKFHRKKEKFKKNLHILENTKLGKVKTKSEMTKLAKRDLIVFAST